MPAARPPCVMAQAMTHANEKFDEYFQWSGPVLQKFKARVLLHTR